MNADMYDDSNLNFCRNWRQTMPVRQKKVAADRVLVLVAAICGLSFVLRLPLLFAVNGTQPVRPKFGSRLCGSILSLRFNICCHRSGPVVADVSSLRVLSTPQVVEASIFGDVVARCVAAECDRPYTALGILEGGGVRIREEPRGTSAEGAGGGHGSCWRRFWGNLRCDGRSESWHEEVYWRLVRGQNCHVFAAQLAFAWFVLQHSSAEDGPAIVLQHRGEPVVAAYIFDTHMRVHDLIASTPHMYVENCAEPVPTYGTIGLMHWLATQQPEAAQAFGIRLGQEDMLRKGLQLCASLGEDASSVCTHRWFVLATKSSWLHLDLCGIAYGCLDRAPSGWPLQSFETRAYPLQPAAGSSGADGMQQLVLPQTQGSADELYRDATDHRHFSFVFRRDTAAGDISREGRAWPLQTEPAASWLRQQPKSWLSGRFAETVRAELHGLAVS